MFSPVLRDVSHDVGGLRVVRRIPQFSQLLSEPGEISLEDWLEVRCWCYSATLLLLSITL